ncbi:MAG: hypothetical protein CL859_09865 [Cyanobium sp. ARS6]|nr:hypothetical protein [Cyanobium sp. ARS6]
MQARNRTWEHRLVDKKPSPGSYQHHDLRQELRWWVSDGLLAPAWLGHPDDASLIAMLQEKKRLIGIGGNVNS